MIYCNSLQCAQSFTGVEVEVEVGSHWNASHCRVLSSDTQMASSLIFAPLPPSLLHSHGDHWHCIALLMSMSFTMQHTHDG